MNTKIDSTNPVKITDTTLRDAHQSLAATRMRTIDMEPIASKMNAVGFHSLEVWGGATFDVATRFLHEDPWERIETLKKLMPDTPLQMLLRGQNLVGYRNYADDLCISFVQHSADSGVDIFRIFDALNDERNLKTTTDAVLAANKHAQLALCYSVTEEGCLGGDVYTLEYYVNKAKIFEDMGASSICIKDMAGLLSPYDAYNLIKALKESVNVPLQLHTHYTSGMASMTVLKAIEAGLDIVDTCLSPLALRTSQPAIEPLIVTLQGTERDTGFDLEKITPLNDYFEGLKDYLGPFLSNDRLAVIDTQVLSHQVPGGMISNLTSQLREAEALDRLPEVLEELPVTRKELGYPPLVTPTSQMVGVQSVNNVLFGRWNSITSQVKDYCFGLYGMSPKPIDKDVLEKALDGYERGTNPITIRPGDILEPELEKAKKDSSEFTKGLGDVLTYALYPVTGETFLKIKYGLQEKPEEPLPEPPSSMLPQAQSGNFSSQARDFNITIGNKQFQITVDPVGSQGSKTRSVSRIPSQNISNSISSLNSSEMLGEGEIALVAPMPGIIIREICKEGDSVKAGAEIIVLEAMKMENALPSPVSGIVKSINFKSGDKVSKGDMLVIIKEE